MATLGAGEVRAAVILDDAALFGGIAAEGRVGDAMLINDVARFVIQGPRPGSYYFSQGGGLLDADIVRPPGAVGRDIVEEWRGVFAGPRLMDATSASVIDDGVGTGLARVVTRGPDHGIDLITGAVEAPDLLPSFGLDLSTEYRLRPHSHFLEVTSAATATGGDVELDLGDVLIVGTEVAQRWRPGAGLDTSAFGRATFTGAIGRGNDVAVMLATLDGSDLRETIPLLSSIGTVDLGIGAHVALTQGETGRYTRLYGVGPDLATLTDELLALRGTPSVEVSGVVTAPDGPVGLARVVVFTDGDPWTVAVTDSDGAWSARAPDGPEITWRAVGRSAPYQSDLPKQTGNWSPFVTSAAGAVWKEALAHPGEGAGAPVGRGLAPLDAPLTLGEPAHIVVQVADEVPFEARLQLLDTTMERDRRIAPGPASGVTTVGWARSGEVQLDVPAGHYHLLGHRGVAYERDEADVTVAAGETRVVQLSLPEAYAHPGWLFADLHQHASPSNDGKVSMEERILANAARGVQLPFGTDHDRVEDYNVLIGPMGLSQVMHAVVADEVSPVRRGHINAYPITVNAEAPNHGAWIWYEDPVESTAEEFAILRDRHPGALLQANHPLGNKGLADAAGWSPGHIGRPDFWTPDFDCMEVINAGDSYLEVWFDLVTRGQRVTPTGVTDSHTPTGHGLGFNGTWIAIGTDDPAAYTDDALREALLAGRTVVTRGPFLDLSVMPGGDVPAGTELDVAVLSPSWMVVDQVELWRDGVVVETVPGTQATFSLSPDADAIYVVMARGSQDMGVYNAAPWAMSGAYYVDVGGDGWTPPLPPLVLEP